MNLFIVSFLLTLSNLAQASCLDISGSYDTGYYGGMPSCARGTRVEKVWWKYQQNACAEVNIHKVYKLVDGSFCEGPLIKQLADGAEHQGGNPDYTYKYEIQNDRHIFTLKNISNGNVSTVEKTLDAQGNLVAHGSDGNHEVFQRDPIN